MRDAGRLALIVAGPGWLRDSLRAMLVSFSDVAILEADDTAMAELLLHEHHPHLLILDGDLPNGHTMRLVVSAQLTRPRTRCTVLVNDVRQQTAAIQAGADHAPFKGEPPPRFFAQVEQLLKAA